MKSYQHANAVVVGIPPGGILVAAEIAAALDLPLEVLPCSRIKHPNDSSRSIGSISLNDVLIHHFNRDIPQDYIARQISMIQPNLRNEYRYYNGDHKPLAFENKTVIVVDDLLQSDDNIVACIKSIKQQNPSEIIVAVPFVSPEVALSLQSFVDDILFIRMEQEIDSESMDLFQKVNECDAKTLLVKSRDRLNLSLHQ